ncbi:MAG: ABC transporter ATP-binding protein [Geminicoccaceae bacterium]|nr:ABC transporter ATP-binding protein [Geminicoccaceae bacterium]
MDRRAPVGIRFEAVSKHYGGVRALDRVSLEVEPGEFLTLLGPSGSGKTTLLMVLAGFSRPTSGRVLVGGEDVTRTPPHRRDFGVVFQSYALFPHMTVAQNVAYPLRMRGRPRAEIARKVADALALVRLEGLGERRPDELSGGQKQRVALARAVVFEPRVLLMDEPLSALDKKLREAMQIEIRRLHERLGITTIYVTHDQAEAMVLADRIAVLRDGALQQVGPPEAIYRRPANAWVAEFIGLTNFIAGEVAGRQDGRLVVRTGVGTFTCQGDVPGGPVLICVRPEALHIGATLPNRLRAVVRERVFLGNLLDYRMEGADGLRLRVQADPSQAYVPGVSVDLAFAPDEAWVVPAAGG